MKKKNNKVLALTLVLTMMTSIMSPALAADNDATQTSPVKLTAQPIVFDVGVPTGLPVDVDDKGNITVATDIKIENNSAAPIAIVGIQVNPYVDWSIVPMNKDFKGTKIGTKEFGFILNNDEVPTNGTVSVTKSNWPSINGGSNLPLIYNSVVSPQKESITRKNIADVIFTIGWDTDESETPPVENIVLSSDKDELRIDESATISITNPKDSLYSFTSSNPAVVSVSAIKSRSANANSSAIITGEGVGRAEITVTDEFGNKGTKDIIVIPINLTSLEITTPPTKTAYDVGDVFNPVGMVLVAHYNDNSTYPLDYYKYDTTPITADQTFVEISYSERGITKTANCPITVNVPDVPVAPEPAIGTKYTDGNYEYSYGQQYISSWANSSFNGWGVRIIDNTKISYAQPLEVIQSWPVTSYAFLFLNYPNAVLTLDGTWTNKNVTDMTSMFASSKATTLDLSNFNTPNVKNMRGMFSYSQATTLDLSNFDTSNVTNMEQIFDNSKATTLNLSNFKTSNVINMHRMFAESQATTLDLSNFDTSNVTNMPGMFYYSRATEIKGLDNFDTSNVTNMGYMFQGSQATSLNLSKFNTSKVTNMVIMFTSCQATTLDLSNFDTSNVTDMSQMFAGSQATSIIGLSNFNTSNVTKMSSMFYESKATTLDLSSFNTSKVIDMNYMSYMFYKSPATTGYARTQADANKFNASSNKPSTLTFRVKTT